MLSFSLFPLGTCAANFTKYQQFSAYILKWGTDGEEHQILLDCGSDHILNPKYLRLDTLDLIIISHHHIDHTRYFPNFIKSIERAGRSRKLKIMAHPLTIELVKKKIKFSERANALSFLEFVPVGLEIKNPVFPKLNEPCLTDLHQVITMEPLVYSLGDQNQIVLNILAAPAWHNANSIAVRFNIDLQNNIVHLQKRVLSLVYSPDTAYKSDYLASFAQNVDYWLLDTTFTKKYLDEYYQKFLAHKWGGKIKEHSSPEYSAMLCEKAGVKNYIIIHYFWKRFASKYPDAEKNLVRCAAPLFKGGITVAKDLIPIPLNLD